MKGLKSVFDCKAEGEKGLMLQQTSKEVEEETDTFSRISVSVLVLLGLKSYTNF